MRHLVPALAALAFAVVFALLPVEQQTAEYHWDPTADGPRVPLLLIERTPNLFELTFPCRFADGAQQQLFVSSRSPDRVPSLVVYGGESQVIAESSQRDADSAGDQFQLRHVVQPEAGCMVTVRYDRAGATLSAASGGEATALEVSAEAFELTGLHWSGPVTEDVRAVVHTSAFSMVRNSLSQKVALGAALILAIASLLSLLVTDRGWRLRAGWWRRPRVGKWLHPSEWAMAVVALVVALIDLPRVDDGRILARAQVMAGLDLSANVSNLFENRIVPQRWLYEWLLGTTVGWSTSVLIIRLLSVVSVVAAWILLRRVVVPAVVGGPPARSLVVAVWAVHAVFVAAWSATLRPEPLIVLLVVVVLGVTASWPSEPRVWPSATVVGAVGLAAATHVGGLAAAFAALPAAALALRDLRRAPVPVLTGIGWGTSLALFAMLVGSNAALTAAAASAFDSSGGHGYGPADVLRYVSTVGNSTAPMMFSAGLAFIGLIACLVFLLGRVVRRVTASSRATAVVLGAALSPLALFLTPSKWIWHLAILAPIAVVGWTVLQRWLRGRRGASVALMAFVSALLAMLMTWAMRPVWNARMVGGRWRGTVLRELSPTGWADRIPWLVGPDARWWLWVALLLLLVVLALLIARLKWGISGSGAPVALVVLVCFTAVTVVQLTPPAVDAYRGGGEWTFVRQSVIGLVDRDVSCGVPAATPAIARRAEAIGDPGLNSPRAGIAGHSGVYLLAPCHAGMRQADGVWKVPALLMGDLTHEQRRAAVEYGAVPIGCNSFPRERAQDRLCFYQLVADGDQLSPTSVRWGR